MKFRACEVPHCLARLQGQLSSGKAAIPETCAGSASHPGMDVDAEQLDQAVRKRKAYILENLQCAVHLEQRMCTACRWQLPFLLDPRSVWSRGRGWRKARPCACCRTTTVKQCRALLEKDLNLAEGALKPHKDLVNTLIDKVRWLAAQRPQAGRRALLASAGLRSSRTGRS